MNSEELKKSVDKWGLRSKILYGDDESNGKHVIIDSYYEQEGSTWGIKLLIKETDLTPQFVESRGRMVLEAIDRKREEGNGNRLLSDRLHLPI